METNNYEYHLNVYESFDYYYYYIVNIILIEISSFLICVFFRSHNFEKIFIYL